MGLDVSHGCWSGAYSAFSRWRNHLADAAGYVVAKVEFPGDRISAAYDTVLIDWGHVTGRNLMGEWADHERPKDPLIYLIAHSDCEGILTPAEAAPLADRLEELLPLLDESLSGGHIQSMTAKTQQFIDGLRFAVEQGEDVEFW